jgi:hypothetical protein
MRNDRITLALAAAGLLAAATPSAGEVTKSLRASLSGADLQNFAVENLAGTMRIAPGPGEAVEVVATVHARNQELADGVRLERVSRPGGAASLRIRYPSSVTTIRYRAPRDSDEISIGLGLSSSKYDYDGRRFRVATGQGDRVWADLDVRVPTRLARALFRNMVGLIEAQRLDGTLAFDVGSADLRLQRLSGAVSLEGSSGDIRASEIRGTWESRFSSGDCELKGFEGDAFAWHSSSGDLRARDLRASRVEIETSSGDADLKDADLEELRGESSSGDLSLEATGARLRSVRAHTSSGNVTLRLPPEASFDATADQSSGDMRVDFSDGTSTHRHDKLIAYRRGAGGTTIRLETSSGDVSIEPR